MEVTTLKQVVDTIVTLKAKLKCAICLDVIQNVIELHCGHKYCKQCYSEYTSTKKQASCPLCKAVVKRRSIIYTDNYESCLGKFVYNWCENIRKVYKCEVEQLQKKLKEGGELFSESKSNILQQNVTNKDNFAVPSTSNVNVHDIKPKNYTSKGQDRTKFVKKSKPVESAKENCESAFDKLMRTQPTSNFNKKGNKRVYTNKKKVEKKRESDYNILEFDNYENKTAVLQWLHDTRNKFDRLSQTQFLPDEGSEIPIIDLTSVSQTKGLVDQLNPNASKIRKGRAKSLEIEIKKAPSTQVKRRSHGISACLENYDIEDINTEEEEVVKKAEEKVLLDLIEDEFLDKLETEMQNVTDPEFEVTSKRHGKPRRARALSPTSATGWDRLTRMKKTIRKTERAPKQLNITLQSTQEQKARFSDAVDATTVNVSTMVLRVALTQADFTKATKKIVLQNKNDLSEGVIGNECIKVQSEKEGAAVFEEINVNCRAEQAVIRNEEADIENKSRPPERVEAVEMKNPLKLKEGKMTEAEKDHKQSYDLQKLEEYITKNMEIIDKNTSNETNFSQENNKVPDKEILNVLERQSQIQEHPVDNDYINDLYNIPTQKNRSSHEFNDNDVTKIDGNLPVKTEPEEADLQSHQYKQDILLDGELDSLYDCPTQKIKPSDTVRENVDKYTAADLLRLFESCLANCIQNAKSADVIVENHLLNLKFYLTKLKSLHKNDEEIAKKETETCDVETQTVLGCADKAVQTEPSTSNTEAQTDTDLIVEMSQSRKTETALEETKIEEKVAASLKQRSQNDIFTCSLDDVDFDTQDIIKNQGTIKKIRNVAQNNEKVLPGRVDVKVDENLPGSVLLCSVNSAKPDTSKRINRKLKYDMDRSARFKRIRQFTSDSDSEVEAPAKRQRNRFVRDDVTVVFLSDSGGSNSKEGSKTPAPGVQNSEEIDYDEYLTKIMKKYEDNTFSETSPQLKSANVSAPNEKKIKFNKSVRNIDKKINPAPEISAVSSIDSFKTASNSMCNDMDEVLMDDKDELFMNEENLLKMENDMLLAYGKESVKGQNSEISDIIGETEELEPSPKKLRKTTVQKTSLQLKNLNSEKAFENVKADATEAPSSFNKEGKIKILANVKIKSQDRKNEGKEEEENLFSDEDVIETTPQKKFDNFAERSSHTQIMNTINLVDRSLPVPLTETNNFDFDVVPLPPPLDFQDDLIDIPSTPEEVENDEDQTTITNFDQSSQTPDNLSQFMFHNVDSAKPSQTLSPCIMQFNKETQGVDRSIFTNNLYRDKTITNEGNDVKLSPIRIERTGQRNMVHSTPMHKLALTRETLGFSPITSKKSQKMSVIETAQAAKYSPLNCVAKPTPQKSNLMTSTPRQRSMWNYVKGSQSSEDDAVPVVKTKPCIACTRLSKDQIKLIVQLTNKKLATYNPQYDPSVTHMIVVTNEESCIKDYTIKFVSAVAAGIWVLKVEWIEECLSKNAIVPEEPFEALDISGYPGPRTARLTSKENPLYRGFKFFCAEPFISTTKKEIEVILKMLGGKVLRNMKDLLEEDGNIGLIIGEGHATQEFEQYERWIEQYKTVTVDIEWLSKCVGQYKILSIRPYIWCSDDNLDNLGYPATLIETVPLSFTETF